MKLYELLYITDPSNEETIEDVKKKIEGVITGREGTVKSFEKLGKKRLAYPIQKRQYGVYFLVYFHGNGRIVQALDYFMRLNNLILRHIILILTDKQLRLKEMTEKIQKEETERMRRGGRPIVHVNGEKEKDRKIEPEETSSTLDDKKVTEEEDVAKKQVVAEKPVQPETEASEEKQESSEIKTEETGTAAGEIDESNEQTME